MLCWYDKLIMTTIAHNLQKLLQRISDACAAAQRPPGSVQLLAVSKTFELELVQQALAQGQCAFGENYVQEGVGKILALRTAGDAQGVQWHCIGPLQSNKSRLVAEHFDWVQSVDRLRIAQRLSEQRPPHLPDLQVCLQVNVDGGASKAGVGASELAALARAVQLLPRLRLRGLMCIPDPVPGFEAQKAVFARCRDVFDQLNDQGFAMDTLSMGMSDDLEAAISAGSTMVRVGRGLFGTRPPKTGA